MRDVGHMFVGVTCNTYCNSKYCTFVRSDVTVTCTLLPTGGWRPSAYLVVWDDSSVYMATEVVGFDTVRLLSLGVL